MKLKKVLYLTVSGIMKKQFLFIVLVTIVLFNLGCKKSLTEPVPDNTQPGRRDYAWTVDTIKIPFTFLYRIWGSSANDVWAVGPGGGLDQTIWHYDGSKWKTDGISRGISPLAVWGFGNDDVWIVGHEGKIWHNAGGGWTESFGYKKNGFWVDFEDIWGDAPNNIYVTGFIDSGNVRKGLILNFNGSRWNEITIPNIPYSFSRIRRGNKENANYYLYGYGGNAMNSDNVGLFELFSNSIRTIYEASFSSQNWAFIQEINSNLYFVIGNRIQKYLHNEFIPVIQINDSNFGAQIYGRSSKDIFLRMFDGIAHYNGSNYEYLYKFNDGITIVNAIIFEKEVFFLALDVQNNLNLIIKGKLAN